MITLRAMQPAEYPAYLDYFLPDYASEIARNYGTSAAEALARAQSEIVADLPQGPQTPGQALLCIALATTPQTVIGYLWHHPDPAHHSTFILDFHILPALQGHGYGTAALTRLEHDLTAVGITRIGLRVAADNPRAEALYRACGFHPTGTNMTKAI